MLLVNFFENCTLWVIEGRIALLLWWLPCILFGQTLCKIEYRLCLYLLTGIVSKWIYRFRIQAFDKPDEWGASGWKYISHETSQQVEPYSYFVVYACYLSFLAIYLYHEKKEPIDYMELENPKNALYVENNVIQQVNMLTILWKVTIF